mmetsp:Transcript_428/g.456  ORF Transcript_428/g.456 Transcript_428/m.456 type:complete len:367 (+) Transcript_428:171-1271(+)
MSDFEKEQSKVERVPFFKDTNFVQDNANLDDDLSAHKQRRPHQRKILQKRQFHLFAFILLAIITVASQQQQLTSTSSLNISCTFEQQYDQAPVPLILMALGRSGSSVTWDTISTLLGSTTKASEITGGNEKKALAFFDKLSNEPAGKAWAIERLCQIQKFNMESKEDPVISGFQWKPYRATLKHELGRGALEEIAKFNDPPIKIIFLQRNPLDRLISNRRHKGRQHSGEAHCPIDDVECIDKQKEYAKGIILPTGKELFKSIKDGLNIDQLSRDYLSTIGVKHIAVSYEKLYNVKGNRTQEWERIFDFLERSPKDFPNYKDHLSMDDIESAFATAPTSLKSHKETIANYEDVNRTLTWFGWEYLLH